MKFSITTFVYLWLRVAEAVPSQTSPTYSIRGRAQQHIHKQRRVLRSAPIINFRELQDTTTTNDDDDLDCTNFIAEYDANLQDMVQEMGQNEWVEYICNQVVNEMLMRPIIQDPARFFMTDSFGDYGTCALTHFEHALQHIADDGGLQFLPHGGFGAQGNNCQEFLTNLFAETNDGGDGRRLELISLIILSVVVVVGGGTVALGGLAGSGVGLAAAGGAFDSSDDEDEQQVIDPVLVCIDAEGNVNGDDVRWSIRDLEPLGTILASGDIVGGLPTSSETGCFIFEAIVGRTYYFSFFDRTGSDSVTATIRNNGETILGPLVARTTVEDRFEWMVDN